MSNIPVKLEIDNAIMNSIGVIIPGIIIAFVAYLIIKFDKRRYGKQLEYRPRKF